MSADLTLRAGRRALEQRQLDELCINTIRCLAMDAVQKANSGHPGLPMGAAPMAYVLWTKFLKHNPCNPNWPNRDRFILSPGHGCMLLYALLHLTGYELSLDDIKQFREWGSKTPGHPEYLLAKGIEATTGNLGQGFANGVGMGIAQKYLAAHFNRPGHAIVDYRIYVLVSDGDLMEGVSSEAASLAGHLGLDNLIYLYDNNKISIEGSTDLAFSEDVGKRFEAYGWSVQKLSDGNNLGALDNALRTTQMERSRPSLIIVTTHIGFGSPHKQDTAAVHGAPLGEEELKLTKQRLGWPLAPKFFIPKEALAHFREAIERGKQAEVQWQNQMEEYLKAFPELAAEWNRYVRGELPKGWEAKIPVFDPSQGPLATRQASGGVLNSIASTLPMLVGGSGDLAPSTDTMVKGPSDFKCGNYSGRNLHFGVREHAMGAILNGMALSGLLPYGGTFLIFSDYARPAVRFAALMRAHVIFIFTHDSIFLGEDGPTHQPIEHLAALRAMPNLMLIRPADANETAIAWRVAIERKDGPVALALTRQKLPIIDRSQYASADGLSRGAYVLADAKRQPPQILLIATGSEVSVALGAYKQLSEQHIGARVVSMPSWDLFERQSQSYKDEVLPPAVVFRLAIEAASPFGWERYIGSKGAMIGMRRFGASAPFKVLAEEFGFTAENIVERAHRLMGHKPSANFMRKESCT